MKMKEVCAKTGLTERTVRFYLEKELLSPQSYWKNGRTYFEFTEGDISKLRQIAAMRRYGFTVEEIRTIYTDGEQIGLLLRARVQALEGESEQAAKQAETLRQLPNQLRDGAALGNILLRLEKEPEPVDIDPDFGRADAYSEDQKREMADQAWEKLAAKGRIRRIAAAVIAAVCIIAAGVFGKIWYDHSRIFTIFTSIPGEVIFTELDYRETSSGDKVPCAAVSTPQGDFLGVFENSLLYDSLFADTPYAMVSVQLQIPQKELAALGVPPEQAGQRVEEIRTRVFSDEELCLRYLTVVRVQGDS